MSSSAGRAGGVAIAMALLSPAFALALPAAGGTFTSTQADIHVAKGGGRIVNAQINCRLRAGVTLESIEFQQPIQIKVSGSFAYRGQAFYVKSSSHRSTPATAAISGRFATARRVSGTVKGGPGACHSVKFAATYNPRAH